MIFWRLDGTRAALRSPFPWVALSAALAITAAGWFALQRVEREEARLRFERHGDVAAAELRARLVVYEQALRSGAAYLATEQHVAPDRWHRFATHLGVRQRLPGMSAIGYANIAGADSAAAPLRIQFSDPPVAAEGPAAQAEALRRTARLAAQSSGEVAVSARATLPREANAAPAAARHGVFMFVPVHRELPGDLPRSERARSTEGYAFAALSLDTLVRDGMGDALQAVDLRIYDEAAGPAQEVLADSRPAATGAADPAFVRLVHFPMPGRNWTLQFASRPLFDRALRGEAPWGELTGGLLASALVFLLVTALMEAWNRTHNLSVRDPLTGLYNRRYLEETMGREVPRAARNGRPVALIVLDLDHFKRLNDGYGHGAGDFVLARFAELLRNATRGEDIACRFGGEEFGVVLPGTSLEVARKRAEAIRLAFRDMAFEYEGVRLGHLTVSAGVAALQPHEGDWTAVLRQADRALYVAKQAGRDRVLTTLDL